MIDWRLRGRRRGARSHVEVAMAGVWLRGGCATRVFSNTDFVDLGNYLLEGLEDVACLQEHGAARRNEFVTKQHLLSKN